MEPFQDDMMTRRLDDVTHQLRMLTLRFSTFQLEPRTQRQTDRWDRADATQKTLVEMLAAQKEVLAHQRTINGRLAMYVEQQTAINDRLATALDALQELLRRGNQGAPPSP